MRRYFVNPGHGTKRAGQVAGTVVFEHPTWKNFRLYADDSCPFDVPDLSEGVHNVPTPLDDLDAEVAPVLNGDPVREDVLLLAGV